MLSAPMMGDCTNDTMMFSGLDSVSQNTVPPTLCGDLTGHESRNFSNLFVSEVEAITRCNNCSVRDCEVRHGRGQDCVQHRLDGEQLQVQYRIQYRTVQYSTTSPGTRSRLSSSPARTQTSSPPPAASPTATPPRAPSPPSTTPTEPER